MLRLLYESIIDLGYSSWKGPGHPGPVGSLNANSLPAALSGSGYLDILSHHPACAQDRAKDVSCVPASLTGSSVSQRAMVCCLIVYQRTSSCSSCPESTVPSDPARARPYCCGECKTLSEKTKPNQTTLQQPKIRKASRMPPLPDRTHLSCWSTAPEIAQLLFPTAEHMAEICSKEQTKTKPDRDSVQEPFSQSRVPAGNRHSSVGNAISSFRGRKWPIKPWQLSRGQQRS